ncbi:MAG: ABC transporter ATP-binding protein, partial [Acidobacteriaceae bacterium]|nr:ABC transporter ATP-binding protein [Acidobacteriaceae bacterium]
MTDFDHVELSDVTKNYGRRRAVARVSMTVRRGEIVGLLGPNGAGKSTLLSMMATLSAPSTGSIRYGGKSAREGGAALRARVGVLGHELHLYPELSARQNLTFFASLHGLSAADVVDKALIAADLAERGDDPVSAFSRGMRQR